MCPSTLIASILLSVLGLHAATPDYPRDITKWEAVVAPPEAEKGAWLLEANRSHLEWHVFTEDGVPSAEHGQAVRRKGCDRPKFTPKVGMFSMAPAFALVDDGWLVGFNHGEFGAALFWFSHDGETSYKISDHQVVEFFSLPDGVHAIEGLAHMGRSLGSVICVARPKPGEPWQAASIAKLPFAPYAVSLRKDGTMLITLSDSLVSIGPDRKINTLLANAPWRGLYPSSSIIQPDDRRLYIGMRQFVGEFDLATNKFRFLIPSKQILDKLLKEDEDRIRK